MTRTGRDWRTWRRTSSRPIRMPGRRTTAVTLAAAVAATGITYAGLHLDGDREETGPAPRAKPVTEAVAVAQAARSGKSVEVTAARTGISTTWARPDGLMAKRLYSSPVRAKVVVPFQVLPNLVAALQEQLRNVGAAAPGGPVH